jgi:hypothetical protein
LPDGREASFADPITGLAIDTQGIRHAFGSGRQGSSERRTGGLRGPAGPGGRAE